MKRVSAPPPTVPGASIPAKVQCAFYRGGGPDGSAKAGVALGKYDKSDVAEESRFAYKEIGESHGEPE